ncbi:hypothetical protein BS47DRAFT_1402317 [Hydnum rufescens UP504]|uniref:Uncharacterized protein n=1 Tax=Hydnum rufescens UP504 TaxID=1448309 RepID=A0A9P6ADU8_9AGAM|nr:hypothetical protein BS47DRAFT_1402317 [Hydnum rufescens UP504]
MSSAAATSSFNAVIGLSRAHRSAGPFRIQFKSDWQSTRIMEWHHSLGSRPTKINTLQLRKEKSEPFTHQYVVLILSDDTILRLDRRGDEKNPMDAMKSDGIESIDTIADVNSLSGLEKTSHCLAELHCQASDLDLSNIIKICFGIHKDPKAGRYTLQRFNCYFFAWTILVATARYAEPWDTFPFDSPWRTLSQTLADALSTKFADALINMMVNAQHLGDATMVHTSFFAANDPNFGEPTLHSALADLRVSTLRTTLWKDDVGDAVRDAARRDVIASLLNAGTEALSSIRLTMEDVHAFQSLAVNFLDRDFLEALGADAFMDDDRKWDEVWNSIRDTIRDAAKDAMKGVEEGRWAALWDGLMEEWVAGWELVRPEIRETARGTVKEMTDLVNNALAYSVVKTLPDTHIHIAWGYTVPSRLHHASNSKFIAGLADLAHSELQPYMLKLIRKHGNVVGRYKLGSPAKVENDMREAMDRVWRAVVELDRGGADAIAANVDLS